MNKEKINCGSVFDPSDVNRYSRDIYAAAWEVVTLLDGISHDRADIILKVARKSILPSLSVVCSQAKRQSD